MGAPKAPKVEKDPNEGRWVPILTALNPGTSARNGITRMKGDRSGTPGRADGMGGGAMGFGGMARGFSNISLLGG